MKGSLYSIADKIIVGVCIMLTAALLSVCTAGVYASAKAEEIVIDDDEYNLYVDEYPDCVNDGIYAKFKTSKSNVDDYYLNLSSDEADEKFSAALVKAKVPVTGMETGAMIASLWQDTDDEPKKVSTAVEVLLPLPSDAQEHPEDCALYMVSNGSAKQVAADLVHDDYDIYYMRFTISSYTTYGFVYPDSASYEDEEEPEEEDPEDKEEENLEPEKEPTPTPGSEDKKDPTPTPKPQDKKDPTPTPKAKDTKAPTPVPVKDNKTDKAPLKDSIPKTGDSFPLEGMLAGAAAAFAGVVIFTVLLKKRR